MQEIPGTGGWDKVKLGVCRGIKVAVKYLHQEILSEYNLSLFSRELNITSHICHPNLLQFIEAIKFSNLVILTKRKPTRLCEELERSPIGHLPIITIARDVALVHMQDYHAGLPCRSYSMNEIKNIC